VTLLIVITISKPSLWLVIDVNSILWIVAASTFMVKIGGSLYFLNVGNNAHVHTVFRIVFLSLLGKYWDGGLKEV
jgi:hypothetical protein